MRRFHLVRREDLTGVSGTGMVAEGVEFEDGQCVMSWLTQFHSLGIYPNSETLIRIHGHEGRTTIEWLVSEVEAAFVEGYHAGACMVGVLSAEDAWKQSLTKEEHENA